MIEQVRKGATIVTNSADHVGNEIIPYTDQPFM